MRIITISREFGSGGRELGRRIAKILGFDYYDKEIISEISKNQNLNEKFVEKSLDDGFAKNIPLTYGRSFYMPFYNVQTNLLVEERNVIEKIAQKGKDFVIVGRNADVILKEYNPLNLFICSTMASRVERCMANRRKNENYNEKEMEKKIRQIDKSRIKMREIVTCNAWGQKDLYHFVINTSNWEIPKLSNAVAALAVSWFEKEK